MRNSPINRYSLKWSCGMHGLLLMGAVMIPLLPQYRPRELPVVTEFTVVIEENLVETQAVQQPPTPTPPQPQPQERAPTPDKPAPLPDLSSKDVITVEKKPDKKPPDKKPQETAKKPEFVKSTNRVTRTTSDFSTLQRVTTAKALSAEEIKKLLNAGAKPGVKNQVPPDETSRCLALIKQALDAVWEQPGGAGGSSRPVVLDIRLETNGRIAGYNIRQSSGNPAFDKTVLQAAAICPPIRGLSAGFLQRYDTIPISFATQ